ncbi:SAM-dependent methyltransferase [Streptomyces sp. CB01881]|uniref:SAM-dependent methyltransferase n=1 Tax=Streptomyces sp. CB01881 TaxID=2078691 RepID=UPI000CDBE024|nr:SAM-dependent methyltransferase [Streptomyces sp. CB01881]AUY54649.1 methyltransferase [Streptomyces sp. CB01881]TYC70882.1 SAM-dependent methyltransferase [Streptomyces sp. CB01881]
MGWVSRNTREERWPAVDLRMDVPHSARVYDYLIGGKTNFEPDRTAAHASVQAWPALPVSMRTTRTFMQRVVRNLVEEHGVRQFLDIGTGIPTSPNVHEIAQGIAPEARVAYVDNDPIVLTHARALMSSTEEGRTCYVDADLRDPDAILGAPELREVLDLSQPVALSLIAIVHFVLDEDDPQGIVRRFMDELAPGSFLALTVFTGDTDPVGVGGVGREYNARGIPLQIRDRKETLAFFDGYELLDPGVTLVHRWRPDADADPVRDQDIAMHGGVAVKR